MLYKLGMKTKTQGGSQPDSPSTHQSTPPSGPNYSQLQLIKDQLSQVEKKNKLRVSLINPVPLNMYIF